MYLCPVCRACKKSDLIITNGSCGSETCGAGNSFKDFVERDHDTKTLLDEFAIAAPDRVFEEGHYGMASFASSAYEYATAMMKERARRDEMGNVKEATEQ